MSLSPFSVPGRGVASLHRASGSILSSLRGGRGLPSVSCCLPSLPQRPYAAISGLSERHAGPSVRSVRLPGVRVHLAGAEGASLQGAVRRACREERLPAPSARQTSASTLRFRLSLPRFAGEPRPRAREAASPIQSQPAETPSAKAASPPSPAGGKHDTAAQTPLRGGKAKRALAGALLLGLGAVGAAAVLDSNDEAKGLLASRYPDVAKLLEASVFPVLRSAGVTASVPAPLTTLPHATKTPHPPPLSPSSLSPAAVAPPLPPAVAQPPPEPASRASGAHASAAPESVSVKSPLQPPVEPKAPEAIVAQKVKEQREREERLKEQQKKQQARLAIEHENVQMELLLELFGKLSEAQKRLLGVLPPEARLSEAGSLAEVNTRGKGEAEQTSKRTEEAKEATSVKASETEREEAPSPLPSVEEVVAAERDTLQHLSVADLRARLLDLVAQLTLARRYDALRRAEDAQKAQEQALVAYDRKLKTELEKERGRVAAEMQGTLLKKVEEIQETADRRLEAELKAHALLADERVAEERSKAVTDLAKFEGQVLGLHAAFDALSLRAQQAQAVNTLMSVVAAIDDALETSAPVLPQLTKLQEMSRADPILFMAVDSLPFEVTEATRKPVPTAGDLRASVKNNMRACVQAAFVPPNSGIVGHMLARLFSSFYVLESHPPPVDPESNADPSRALAEAASEASRLDSGDSRARQASGASESLQRSQDGLCGLRRNLALLSYASFYVDRGDLTNALRCLEQLDGLTRAVSVGEIQRLRVFLLLQQTLQLVKARLACINADLVAGAETAA
ncbi:hypothetical protein BESB_066820 [Besnoitia besnoiti]|uniref:Formation of crista junctions protein 1 n=1 Tax=Besnoitia besnoiti TaxID=94643 RepID=A0A2A9M9R7_BESBE|nr:hypothetical protein BESB_066820 [Besnoitia besnoiti]PFH34649.1 hypothetical protein BESB_066820 [Besnoitia besnoiti]